MSSSPSTMTIPNTRPNNTNNDAAELATRVHNLPPKVFDKIYDLTFSTAETNKPVKITPAYKAPSRLHVSRASRKKFAKVYYRNTIFEFGSTSNASDPTILNKWLTTLPLKHAKYLARVDYHSPGVTEFDHLPSSPDSCRDTIAAELAPKLRKADLMLCATSFLWVYVGHVPHTFHLRGTASVKKWKLEKAME